jgi:hypothetical protein
MSTGIPITPSTPTGVPTGLLTGLPITGSLEIDGLPPLTTDQVQSAYQDWQSSGSGGDFRQFLGNWVLGNQSSQTPDALASEIANFKGCIEDLLLMIMIAVTKDQDEAIKKKADEVLNLRKQKRDSNGNNDALDQANQELSQMTKQRDQTFQMFQKILDGLTASTDRVLQDHA